MKYVTVPVKRVEDLKNGDRLCGLEIISIEQGGSRLARVGVGGTDDVLCTYTLQAMLDSGVEVTRKHELRRLERRQVFVFGGSVPPDGPWIYVNAGTVGPFHPGDYVDVVITEAA